MSDDEQTARYRFAQVPLRPLVFGELALELFSDGVPHQRADIIKQVSDDHARQGGLPAVAELTGVFKKAMRDLLAAGKAERLEGSYGMYRLGAPVDLAVLERDSEADEFDDDAKPDDELIEEPDLTSGYVYVYDYAGYASTGNERWPHKIGFTDGLVEDRITGQATTAMPERPRTVMKVSSRKARLLERALHLVLELRGQRTPDSPGTEWFDTNPAEIKAIMEFILPSEADEMRQTPHAHDTG